MKIKNIKHKSVTSEILEEYKSKISKLNKSLPVTANDVDMDYRIVTLRFGEDYNELTLVNPKIINSSKDKVTYYERDAVKSKPRKTKRHTSITVDTDNMGEVQFKADKTNWKNQTEFMNDLGLFECIITQRLIDSIDGIDVTSPQRRYSTQITSDKKYQRNDKILLQSPEGEFKFTKYKKAQPFIDKGYEII